LVCCSMRWQVVTRASSSVHLVSCGKNKKPSGREVISSGSGASSAGLGYCFLFMGPKAIEILSARKPADLNPEALVFSTPKGTPLSRRNLLNRQMAPTAQQLGLKGINWHWLRHANATLHDSLGTPLGTLQALLGHSSPEITREHYLHAVPADAKQAVEKMEKLLLDSNGPKWTQVLQNAKPASRLIQ